MTDDPDFRSLPTKDLDRLLERVAAEIARTRDLIETARDAQAHAASLCIESATVLDELYFRKSTLG
jgi:hypothetical protein